MQRISWSIILTAFLVLFTNYAVAASYEKAVMLNQHGLTKEAKAELIDVLFGKASDQEKARSYYLLGSIDFSENRIAVALDTWRELVKKYPRTPEASLVKDRITELAEIVGDIQQESTKNAVAQSYLRHGDFWSRGKDNKFLIDSSWIPNVETAIKWYDKVINEYPGSIASRLAYEGKMRTLLGWEESGRYGSSFGIKKDFSKFMPLLLDTFKNFEKEHPHASTLQAFRYQIAQAYWGHRDWAKTREWLKIIIEKAGDTDTFYKDLAQRRLQKVEY
jgi:tetratricopeptide (TPR) repeat protein